MHATTIGWGRGLRWSVVIAILSLMVAHSSASADEEADSDEFDYSTLEGIQLAVSRDYGGDTAALATPGTAPAAIYYLRAMVFAFDTTDHAAAGLETIHADVQADATEDPSIVMESVDPGDLGDRAVAEIATTDQDGRPLELAAVIVHDGAYVYQVIAVGVGTETGALETATAVSEAMVDAEAGSGDEEFDVFGHSTGGPWDKFPVAGDAVLNGLVPTMDGHHYP